MFAPAVTILLSSFLLFLVQPIVAKQILPWLGGSASVWTVCVVFFQVVLVLGYGYAHLLTRRRAGPRQFMWHILLLFASCAMLPIIPGPYWKQDDSTGPALQILSLLAATVGLPYFLLASTAPLLQRWLSSAGATTPLNPSIYRLFALSNFGSLLGLLSYPFAIEPFAPLHEQAWAWSCAYALFVVSSTIYAWKRSRLPEVEHGSPASIAEESPPSRNRYAYWLACAALGSALLLSGTNHITQNVAAVPLLWIAPLSVYLASFIVCFEGRSGRGWYERRFWVTPAMVGTGVMAWALFADGGNLSVFVAVPLFTAGIFVGCVLCHGELSRTKPNPQYLTHFYLSLAAGGALGGLVVGLVAPSVFKSYWEMPLALAALAVLGLHCCCEESRQRSRTSWAVNFGVAALGAALIFLLLGALPSALDSYTLPWAKIVQGDARWGCAALLIVSAVILQRYRLWRAVAITALICAVNFDWIYYQRLANSTEFWDRNFYGALRVMELPYGNMQLRKLMHGVIVHGTQAMQLPQRHIATTYYSVSSGIGRTLLLEQRTGKSLRIGSIGLGAGTLAAYGRPGDLFRVYELNPAVLEIARHQFEYLSDSSALVQPVLGDARLSLEHEIADGAFDKLEQRFDVLSLDAFSGDAVPVHLLTREAFAVYARVTKPDGVIAFHLSNRFLDLPPVVAQIASSAGFRAVLVADRPNTLGLTAPSDWVLVTRNAQFLQQPEISDHSARIVARTGLHLWTDQFSNLLQILR